MKIRDKEDFRMWTCLLRRRDYFSNVNDGNIIKVKRALREFTHKPLSEERIVKDDGIDGCIVLFPLPDRIKTPEGAHDYFMHTEYRECAPSIYDCTGKQFTAWYKIFKRAGRFWCYHRICLDV